MNLILFRHGEATPSTFSMEEDFARPLVKKGRIRTQAEAEKIATQFPRLDLMITSELVRAVQTADILQENISIQKRESTKRITPDGNVLEFYREFQSSFLKVEAAILVGHEPFLGKLATLLVNGNNGSIFHLRKSGWIHLEWERLFALGMARVVSMSDPRFAS